MKKIFKNKKQTAFTLIEVLITLSIIGFVAAITLSTVLTSKKTELRKTEGYSSHFDSDIQSSFQSILINNTRNFTLENLADRNGDGSVNSTDLAGYFASIMGGELLVSDNGGDEEENAQTPENAESQSPEEGENNEAFVVQNSSCKDLKIKAGSPVADYAKNAVCAEFTHVTAGFVYDNTCSTEVIVKEHLSKEDIDGFDANDDYAASERVVSNACGYVIYSTPKSEGVFKKDVFTIAFGARGIK